MQPTVQKQNRNNLCSSNDFWPSANTLINNYNYHNTRTSCLLPNNILTQSDELDGAMVVHTHHPTYTHTHTHTRSLCLARGGNADSSSLSIACACMSPRYRSTVIVVARWGGLGSFFVNFLFLAQCGRKCVTRPIITRHDLLHTH